MITVIGDSYKETKKTEVKRWRKLRAEAIAEINAFLVIDKQKRNKEWFPDDLFFEMDARQLAESIRNKESREWFWGEALDKT